jgi:triacylglycerol esterase/lipase EstA (alpha/beta hydrolase family)
MILLSPATLMPYEEDTQQGEHKGKLIAVKKLYKHLGLDDMPFKNECIILEKVRHKNIVRLVGYCHDTQEKLLDDEDGKRIFAYVRERLLCFEYFLLGSLDRYISGTNGVVIRIP